MFKLAPTATQLPTGASFVPLDADGRALPSDFYLRVGGAATALLRGDLPNLLHAPGHALSGCVGRINRRARSGATAGPTPTGLGRGLAGRAARGRRRARQRPAQDAGERMLPARGAGPRGGLDEVDEVGAR